MRNSCRTCSWATCGWGRPREQRRTALALHRLRHKNPYYFWAVMSLVLEA
ncbi:hypothetical protein MTO96_045568, partial [Rhipicephalus appendiculatus]